MKKMTCLFVIIFSVAGFSAFAAEAISKPEEAKKVSASTPNPDAMATARKLARAQMTDRQRSEYLPYTMPGMMPFGQQMMSAADQQQPVVSTFSDGSFIILRGNRILKYDNQLNLVKEQTLPSRVKQSEINSKPTVSANA